MKPRIWLALSLIMLLLSSLQTFARSGGCGDEAYWTFNSSDNTLTIYGEGAMTNYSSDKHPGWYDLKDLIKHVVIEEGITSVGDFSFTEYFNIETISLPEGLIHIGNYSFNSCSGIKSITFPETLETIGYQLQSYVRNGYCFTNCRGLEEITIPKNLKLLSGHSFENCINLKTVNWNAVNCITDTWYGNRYEGVFKGCGIETVNFGPDVDIVPSQTFMGITNLTKINTKGSIGYVGLHAFQGTAWEGMQKLGEVIYIDNAAYMYNADNSLDEISIEFRNGTRGVTDYMFEGNNRLEKVAFPTSVGRIGVHAFKDCQSLNEIVWNSMRVDWMNDLDQGYSSIFSSALRKATIGNEVEILPKHLFMQCTNLKYVGLPESLTDINERVFYESGLKELEIPNSVEVLGKEALNGCKNLEKVIFGEGLKNIDRYYFLSGCDKLKTIEWNVIHANPGINDERNFNSCQAPVDNFIVGDKALDIPQYLFWHSGTLKNVKLGESIEEICEGAFRDCSQMMEIQLPETLKVLYNYCFENTSLESVVIPKNVVRLGVWCLSTKNINNLIMLPEVAPEQSSALLYMRPNIYVPDINAYSNFIGSGELLPMAIPDIVDFEEGVSDPQVRFECNIPDYSLEIIEFPELDRTIGKHKSLVTGRFTGKQDFEAKFVYEYEIHKTSQVSTISNHSELVDVYNFEGVMIRQKIEKASINELPAGYYIIRQESDTQKLIVK